jgi:hypothetical protein
MTTKRESATSAEKSKVPTKKTKGVEHSCYCHLVTGQCFLCILHEAEKKEVKNNDNENGGDNGESEQPTTKERQTKEPASNKK